jgi:ribosomal protein S18 acetylase RimI-like enzyme
MTPKIETPRRIDDLTEVTEVITEYLSEVCEVFHNVSGKTFDIEAMAQNTVGNIGSYLPPHGCTWIARADDGRIVGMVYLKKIAPGTAEIKRLYVRPEARRNGLARALTEAALRAAPGFRANRIVLDSLAELHAAQALYRGLGFEYISRYAQSETDPDHDPWLIYMACEL